MASTRSLKVNRPAGAGASGRRAWRLTWASLMLALLALFMQPALAAPVRVLSLQGAIGPASADYVANGLQTAHSEGAPLVVLTLDTPGGLDTSMRQIIQAILASPVPVAAYVSPEGARAASAGTFLLYAAHIAAMAPATALGAATPVNIGLSGPLPEKTDKNGQPDAMTTKQVNDAAALIRGLAQLRGRNADWAERAVRQAASLSSSEALKEHVIEVVAQNIPDLLAQMDGRTVRVQGADVKLATRGLAFEARPPDARQRLLAVITHPAVALLLMMVGIYALIFELASPSFGLVGTAGAVCLLLALFALQLLPVNYAGLALIALGLGLLVVELLAPSFGAFGLGGVIAFIAGGLLLFDRDAPGFGISLPLVLGLAVTTAAVILLGGNMALKARRRPVLSGREALTGESGVMLEVRDGESWAQVRGERWRVRSTQPLAPGQRIRVTGLSGLSGLTLQVLPDPDSQSKTQSEPSSQGASS